MVISRETIARIQFDMRKGKTKTCQFLSHPILQTIQRLKAKDELSFR